MGEILLSREGRPGVFTSRPGVVLATLLTIVLVAALACERRAVGLLEEEIRWLAATQSLAHDFDLDLDDEDRRRLQALSPSMASSEVVDALDGPVDVPPVYPLLTAPLARWMPLRGAVIFNALLLVVAAWVAARRLWERLGTSAPALVGVCIFGSVLYRSVFLLQPTILLTTLVVLAFSLALSREEPAAHGLSEIYRAPESAPVEAVRALVAGSMLGLVALHHPLYLILIVPVLTVWQSSRRRLAAVMAVVGMAVAVAAGGATGGTWLGPVPMAWTTLTTSFSEVSVGLSGWNLLYLLVGRNTGILPYFLPLIALVGLWQGGARRSVLVLTALLGAAAFAILVPFDFYGGPAAVGSRWLLPFFALLWFAPSRPLPKGWLAATVILSVPAMFPTWLAPGIEPITEAGVYRHAAGPLQRWLPLETTQRALPPAGQSVGERFWVRSLSLEATTGGGNRWRLAGEGWAVLQLATPTPLDSLYLQFGRQAEPQLEVRGAEVGDMVLLPDGGVGFSLEEPRRRALHPMWWSGERFHNYVIELRMPMQEPRPQSLVLTAIARDMTEGRP